MHLNSYSEFSASQRTKSSVRLIDYKSFLLFNGSMDTIEDTRQKRLLILIAEYKTASALSDIVDISEAQLSQWKNKSPDSKTGRPRAMDSDSARNIEERTKKPRGWMDQPVENEEKEKIKLSLLGLKREDINMDLIEHINLYIESAKEDKSDCKSILAGTGKDKKKKPRERNGSDNDQ